ncbi:MAG: hypothetical protein KF773_40380 [Deltaproteobacteria bacterium]|nr:hypothetical protein [Deltaproteobacteria bacterium]
MMKGNTNMSKLAKVLFAVAVALVACKSKRDDHQADMAAKQNPRSSVGMKLEEGAAGAAMPGARSVRDDGERQTFKGAPAEAPKKEAPPDDGKYDSKDADQSGVKGGGGRETATRSWFPETFLFEPRLVTDNDGTYVHKVKVPDRLTTWRVLALGHARNGAQGGAVTSFLGTLPTYVDLVVPPFLVVGDEIQLPVQAVNTTPRPVAGELALKAEGADVANAGGARTIPAEGSLVEYATLKVARAGRAKLTAAFGATDAVEHTVEVVPSGKPVTVTRSGTLAAPRKLTLAGPAGADPATDRVRLQVFPGAIAVLRSELGVSALRGGVAEDAYALFLAGRATSLLASLGDKANAEVVRELSILTAQRAIRDARTLDVVRATAFVEPALAHPDNPVLARLGERAAAWLATHQRPDGTFAGGTGWTLQRVLVATADATRAIAASAATPAERQRLQAVRVKAQGAFERNLGMVVDGYTAAAILASRAVSGPVADKLKDKVRAGLKKSGDGAQYLAIDENTVRADGTVPGVAEATALAVLALAGDARPLMADLGATLLGGYTPMRGWGDGQANLVCLRAVIDLFQDPVPENVKITLKMDGRPVVEGTLDRTRLRDVMTHDVAAPAGIAGEHTWELVAEPAVPGLGYALALRGWVPWEKSPTRGGLELSLPPAVAATVGKATEIALVAIAPSGMDLHIQHALPAGVQLDRPSLEALVASGALARFESADGKLDLYLPPLQPGQKVDLKYKVVPTLAGTLRSTASLIEAGSTTYHVPPTTWTIK